MHMHHTFTQPFPDFDLEMSFCLHYNSRKSPGESLGTYLFLLYLASAKEKVGVFEITHDSPLCSVDERGRLRQDVMGSMVTDVANDKVCGSLIYPTTNDKAHQCLGSGTGRLAYCSSVWPSHQLCERTHFGKEARITAK